MSARPTIYTWDKKDGGLPLQAKPDGAVLHFSMLNKSDNGVYVCHADNGIGSSEGEYTLLVQGKEKKQKEGKKGCVVTERGRRGTLGCFLSSSRFFIPSFVCCGFACTSIFFLF